MMADKGSILDTLALEEPGIDPEELGGLAYEAAFTSFFFAWRNILHLFISLLERRNCNLPQPRSKRPWGFACLNKKLKAKPCSVIGSRSEVHVIRVLSLLLS